MAPSTLAMATIWRSNLILALAISGAALRLPAPPRLVGAEGGLDRGALVEAGDPEHRLPADDRQIVGAGRAGMHQAFAQGRRRDDDPLVLLGQAVDQVLDPLAPVRHRGLRVVVEDEHEHRWHRTPPSSAARPGRRRRSASSASGSSSSFQPLPGTARSAVTASRREPPSSTSKRVTRNPSRSQLPCASRCQRPVPWMRTGSNRCRPISRAIVRVVSHPL